MTEYGSYWQQLVFNIPDDALKKIIQEQRALGKDDDDIVEELKSFINRNKWDYDYDYDDEDRNMSSIDFDDDIEDNLYEFIENHEEQQTSLGEL
jgi:hypothetical protein